MKHSTYEKLYKAHLGAVDENSLLATLHEESDPFYKDFINLAFGKDNAIIQWDTKPFTTEFLSKTPSEMLDQTFFAFVLRIAAIIKEECYIRMYRKPESFHVILAWISVLRNVILSSIGLLYNVKWTLESEVYYLEPTVLKFFGNGDVLALRQLMTDLGITLAQRELYPAELLFGKLSFLQTMQFGPFYWRFLHWMAEANALRDDDDKDMALYKRMWRDLLKGPLYRTLRCKICMIHFKQLLNENEAELLEQQGDLPRLFYNIHNKTHAIRRESNRFLQEPDYTDDQYKADSEFMRQALLAK